MDVFVKFFLVICVLLPLSICVDIDHDHGDHDHDDGEHKHPKKSEIVHEIGELLGVEEANGEAIFRYKDFQELFRKLHFRICPANSSTIETAHCQLVGIGYHHDIT